jgi:hypothetical protein
MIRWRPDFFRRAKREEPYLYETHTRKSLGREFARITSRLIPSFMFARFALIRGDVF